MQQHYKMPSFICSTAAEYIVHGCRGGDGPVANGRRLYVAALAIICTAMASTLAVPPLVSRAFRSAYLASDAPRAGAAPISGAGSQGPGQAAHRYSIAHRAPPALKSRTVRYDMASHSVAGAGHAALVHAAGAGAARLAAPVLSAGAHASHGLPSFAPTLLLLAPAAAAAVAALLCVCRPRSQAEELGALATARASTAPEALMEDHVEELAAGAKHQWQHGLVVQLAQEISKDAHDNTPMDADNVEAAPPLEDRLGEGMRAAAHNLEEVLGIDMDQLSALCRSAAYLSLEDPNSFYEVLVDGQCEDNAMMLMRMLLDLFQIAGIPIDVRTPIDTQGLALVRNRLLEWVTTKRGSDLFIPGLGGFDIKQVYRDDMLARRAFMDAAARAADEGLLLYDWSEVVGRLFQPNRVAFNDLAFAQENVQISAAARYHLLGWVPSPAELQATAYFPALRVDWLRHQKVASILALPDTNPLRMHLIRHRDWWNDLNHIDALDEIDLVMEPSVSPMEGFGYDTTKRLAEAGVFGLRALAQLDRQQRRALLPELREMSPAQLRHLVEHARRVVPRLPLRWPDGGEGMGPDALLDRMCPPTASGRGYDPGIGFDHLDQLPDGAMDHDGHVLRVLRDPKTAVDVGEWLDNCAADYTDACQGGRYILVALCDEGGDPYALGGYRYAEGAGWTVDRVVGRGNAPPGPNVRQKFGEFVPVIRRWARDRRRTAENESGSVDR